MFGRTDGRVQYVAFVVARRRVEAVLGAPRPARFAAPCSHAYRVTCGSRVSQSKRVPYVGYY